MEGIILITKLDTSTGNNTRSELKCGLLIDYLILLTFGKVVYGYYGH